MKVTVLRDRLREGLAIVERTIARPSPLPILANVLITTEKNFLELSSTDLEIGIRYKTLVKTEEQGKIVIPPHPLSQLASLLPEEQITLLSKEGALSIQAKGYNTSIKTLDPEEFPIIPQPDTAEKPIEIQTKAFCAGLNQVAGMTGQGQARPEISGVFFSFHKEEVKIVATDSFRLAEKTISLEKRLAKEETFILPQKGARELVAVLGERPGKTNIYISPTQAIFDYFLEEEPTQPHIQIISRLVEGEYPKYQDIIPTGHKTRVLLQRGEFLTRLKAASIFSSKLHEVNMFVDPTKGGIELQAQNTDVGENTAFMTAEITGKKTEAAFNWKFLLEGISQIKEGMIEMNFGEEDEPVTMRSLDEAGYFYMVMPIRT